MEPNEIIKIMPEGHWYESPKHKGVFYPSVTAVNVMPKDKYFEKYLADLGSYEESQSILNEAGKRGTRVHEATEAIERGETLDYTTSGLKDDEWELLMSFIKWHKEFSPVVIDVNGNSGIELKLISDKLKLGGTADRVYMINGKRVLFDIKTSKSKIFNYHWTQVAAYAHMYEEIYKQKIDCTAILRLTNRTKKGYEYVVHEEEEWRTVDLPQFKRNYETYKYINGEKAWHPEIKEIPRYASIK